MKRSLIAIAGVVSLGVFAVPAASSALAGQSGYGQRPFCENNAVTCTETYQSIGKYYTGHDEPSVLFYSNTPGSGNNNVYTMRLPKDPPMLPRQNGTGGTFNFQLHPAFWFGMAMCDDQSAPNPGGSSVGGNVPCTPDSNSNIFTSDNNTSPNYIGLHPGTAFMEMQFYPPGYAPWPAGNSCKATLWCAALNIDSLSQNLNAGTQLNPTCAARTGIEYVNFAFITKNGVSQAPASPVNATGATFTPSNADLFMHSGDIIRTSMSDTSNGFRVVINDLTTGQSGSMTASAANGFGEVQYDPAPSTACVNIPTNFHPMYSTSSESTRVVWAAHSYNVAFSDEIGHFEYCNAETNGVCTTAGVTDASTGVDADDVGCFSPGDSTRIRIGGCLGTDVDFDGPEYTNAWPGTFINPATDAQFHPTPVAFTSPRFNGGSNFSRVAFEADLPRVEFATNPPCQRHISNPSDPNPGSGCVNPPVGASFYPFFSTGSIGGHCYWQLGGDHIPGTTNDFGGNSAAEFGPLLVLDYPATGGLITTRYNNFRQVLSSNPCTA